MKLRHIRGNHITFAVAALCAATALSAPSHAAGKPPAVPGIDGWDAELAARAFDHHVDMDSTLVRGVTQHFIDNPLHLRGSHVIAPLGSATGISRAVDGVAAGLGEGAATGATAHKVMTSDRGQVWVYWDDDGSVLGQNFGFTDGRSTQRFLNDFLARFYTFHADVFDFLIVVSNFNVPNFLAAYFPMANDTRGIGYKNLGLGGDIFDTTDSRLQGILIMNDFHNYTGGFGQLIGHFTFAQELGHRWGVYVRFKENGADITDHLGRSSSVGGAGDHWSFYFNSSNSAMEGNRWADIGSGRFRASTDIRAPMFGPFDLYAMGLIPATEVPDTFVIMSPQTGNQTSIDGGLINKSSPPAFNIPISATGTKKMLSIQQLIDAEGPRMPGVETAPKDFRAGFVLVRRQNDPMTDSDLQQVDGVRRFFEENWEFDVGHRANLITNLAGRTGAWGEACTSMDDCDAQVSNACVLHRYGAGTASPKRCVRTCAEDTDCGSGGFGAKCCDTATGDGGASEKICAFDFNCPTGSPTTGGSTGGSTGGGTLPTGGASGAECSATQACVPGLLCVGMGTTGICRKRCGSSADCADGAECATLAGGSTTACILAQEGASCDSAHPCDAGLRCLGSGDTGVCRAACDAAANPSQVQCAEGQTCQMVGTRGACVAPEDSGGGDSGGGGGGILGCSAAGRASAPEAVGACVALAGLGLASARRRRRSP